jgi:hypothetical protein
MDYAWWKIYHKDVSKNFKGDKFCCNPIPYENVTKITKTFFKSFYNSGADAISLAYQGGAKKIILLGYDCQKTDNKTHWHGDHVQGLGNAKRLNKWADMFYLVAEYCKDVPVINSTRQTALNCFKKIPLEQALNE